MPMMMIQVEETLLAMSQTVMMSGRYSDQSEGTNAQHAQYSTVQFQQRVLTYTAL